MTVNVKNPKGTLIGLAATTVLLASVLSGETVHAQQDIPSTCSAYVAGVPADSLTGVPAGSRIDLDCLIPEGLNNHAQGITQLGRPSWEWYSENGESGTQSGSVFQLDGPVTRFRLSGLAPDTLIDDTFTSGRLVQSDRPRAFQPLVIERVQENGSTRRVLAVDSAAISPEFHLAQQVIQEAQLNHGEEGLLDQATQALDQGRPEAAGLLGNEAQRVGRLLEDLKGQLSWWRVLALVASPLAIFGVVIGFILLRSVMAGRREARQDPADEHQDQSATTSEDLDEIYRQLTNQTTAGATQNR